MTKKPEQATSHDQTSVSEKKNSQLVPSYGSFFFIFTR